MKVYRLPPSNPLVWQTSLIDSEITSILQGRTHVRNKQKPSRVEKKKEPIRVAATQGVSRKEIAEEECTICYDSMCEDQHLVWCQKGCGNNFHSQCFKAWADNCDFIVTCPLCRNKWSYEELEQMRKPKPVARSNSHQVKCNHCTSNPIKETRYKCVTCVDYNLCGTCFGINAHEIHPFISRETPESNWVVVERPSPTQPRVLANRVNRAIPTGRQPRQTRSHPPPQTTATTTNIRPDIQQLMQREITSEDYELLLQLDENESNRKGVPLFAINNMPDRVAQPGEQFDDCCPICLEAMEEGQQVKGLENCSHLFHKICIDMWLARSNSCAVCNCTVFYNLDELKAMEQAQNNMAQSVPSSTYTPSLTRTARRPPIPRQPPRPVQRPDFNSLDRVPLPESLMGDSSSSHFQTTAQEREQTLQAIRTKLRRGGVTRTTRPRPTSSGIVVNNVESLVIGTGEVSRVVEPSSSIRPRLRPKSPSVSRKKEDVKQNYNFDLSGVQIGGSVTPDNTVGPSLHSNHAPSGKLIKLSTLKQKTDVQIIPSGPLNLGLTGVEISTKNNVNKGKRIKGSPVPLSSPTPDNDVLPTDLNGLRLTGMMVGSGSLIENSVVGVDTNRSNKSKPVKGSVLRKNSSTPTQKVDGLNVGGVAFSNFNV
ncbi:E3 ubiquitin-protein ligase [Acrasis kona]|uniref:E3 ubiquitin-protein ligase n=1 Tax=Acrasis kona TaxID=1008807 RepID=A0AAW2ZKY0_9EUKA